MNSTITLIRFARSRFVELLDGLSVDQLNKIPDGFNNNLVWNLGHAIAVQQALCYKRAGQSPIMPHELMEKYQGGTAPDGIVGMEGINELKSLALSTIDRMEEDLKNGLFAQYEAFTISTANCR